MTSGLRAIALGSIFAVVSLPACLFPSLGGLIAGGDATAEASAGSDASDSEATTSSQYRTAVMADVPVAYWRLGDATSVTAADEIGTHPGTGKGMHITAGVAGALAGDPNTAFHFGSPHDSWIDIGDVFAFPGAAPFSVELWARMVDDGTWKVLVSKDDSNGSTSGSPDKGYEVFAGTNVGAVPVYFRRYGASSYDNTITQPLPCGAWTYFVATFDGATMRFYVNGAFSTSTAANAEATSTSHLVLAADIGGTGSNYEGDLDEVAIYDKALAATRVLAHWQAAQ